MALLVEARGKSIFTVHFPRDGSLVLVEVPDSSFSADLFRRNGPCAKRVGLESNSKPTGSVDRPSYTFIGHDDDLTSKRIKDANARKKIRSHVMRDVRRRERLAGTKRVSRRESRAGQSDASPTTFEDQDSGEQTLVLRAASQASLSSYTVETEDDNARSRHRRGRPIKWSAGHDVPDHYSPNPKSLPTSWFSDPFSVLPGASEFPVTVESLVFYCRFYLFIDCCCDFLRASHALIAFFL